MQYYVVRKTLFFYDPRVTAETPKKMIKNYPGSKGSSEVKPSFSPGLVRDWFRIGPVLVQGNDDPKRNNHATRITFVFMELLFLVTALRKDYSKLSKSLEKKQSLYILLLEIKSR